MSTKIHEDGRTLPTSSNIQSSLSSDVSENISSTAVLRTPRITKIKSLKDATGPIKDDVLLNELHDLSGGDVEAGRLKCPDPLIPFYNRLVQTNTNHTLIPKVIHVTMKSRCLPRDLSTVMNQWVSQFPNYSIVFHDDEAVNKLIDQSWPEFPDLHRAMKCVFFKGAMVIDIWRVLVLWKYGGVYSDIDNWPQDAFTEDIIPGNVSAFFLTDVFNRPSQWFMALEPRHPLMYDSMMNIIHNIFHMKNLRRPSVVKVTGPQPIKDAYATFFPHLWSKGSDAVFQNGEVLHGRFGKTVLKLWNGNYDNNEHIYIKLKKGHFDIVPFNATLNVTRKERIELESGVLHWQQDIHELAKKRSIPKMSCLGYLKRLNE